MDVQAEKKQAVKAALKAVEAKKERPLSLAAFVKAIAPDLLKAKRDKNLTVEDLRRVLSEQGVEITLGTLRKYLQPGRLGDGVARTRAKKEARATVVAATATPKRGGVSDSGEGSAPKPAFPMPKPPPLKRPGGSNAEREEGQWKPKPAFPAPKPPSLRSAGAEGAGEAKGETEAQVPRASSFPVRRDRERI